MIASRGEWITVTLLVLTYGVWALSITLLPLWLAIPALTLALVLHASLMHEVIHGHPTRSALFNGVLVFPALGLAVPYLRFKDTHLSHHQDSRLTDPYDDPESNFLDPDRWDRLPRWAQALLYLNNTLLGRMILGPAVSQLAFMASDWRLIRAGDQRVLLGWGLHVPAVAGVVLVLAQWGQIPAWAYGLACYVALSILKIRTFLEHRAHEYCRARTVIIEDRGPLAFLFLNNNLHAMHHMHPRLPWYALPRVYAKRRARVLACNEQYFYPSYAAVFRQHLVRAKDPVAHPLLRR